MIVHGSGQHGKDGQIKDRITLEQFIRAGKELLKMFDESAQHKYYFQLFAAGKDHLTKEGQPQSSILVNIFLISPWKQDLGTH